MLLSKVASFKYIKAPATREILVLKIEKPIRLNNTTENNLSFFRNKMLRMSLKAITVIIVILGVIIF